jgi:hypothetical protein
MKIHSAVRRLLRQSAAVGGFAELPVANAATMKRRDRLIECFIDLDKSKWSTVKNSLYKNGRLPIRAAEKREIHFIMSALFSTRHLVNLQRLCDVFPR